MYGHDHTIEPMDAPQVDNFQISYVGLGEVNNETFKTLDFLLGQNNHTGRTIQYLKVSVVLFGIFNIINRLA